MGIATSIHISARGNAYEIISDAKLDVAVDDQGKICPFEAPDGRSPLPGLVILNAFSSTLVAEISSNGSVRHLRFQAGRLEGDSTTPSPDSDLKHGVRLRFEPDQSVVLSINNPSPHIFDNYLRRISHLNPCIRFSCDLGDVVSEYCSERGLLDFFKSITTHFQILHKPIHLRTSEGGVDLEFVFAFHSWSEQQVWSFTNRGRCADGGTHEKGFTRAAQRLKEEMGLNTSHGFLSLMRIRYPRLAFAGCITREVTNKELEPMVESLASKALGRWLRENPVERARIQGIESFKFADTWNPSH